MLLADDLGFHYLPLQMFHDPRACLLVGDHDLEARDDLCKRDGAVCFPYLEVFGGVDEDDEVLLVALVEHLVLLSISARHLGWWGGGLRYLKVCKGVVLLSRD